MMETGPSYVSLQPGNGEDCSRETLHDLFNGKYFSHFISE